MEYPLPLTFQDFTFNEDKLILSIVFTTPEALLDVNLINVYEIAHSSYPQLFPKPKKFNEKSNCLLARSIDLTSALGLMLKYVSLVTKTIELEYLVNQPTSKVKFVGHFLENANPLVEQQMYGRDKVQMVLNPETLQLVYTVRRVQIQRISGLLAKLIAKANVNINIDNSLLSIILTDECCCTYPHTQSHITSELLDKFLIFSRHPQITQDLDIIQDQMKRLHAENLHEQKAIMELFSQQVKRRNDQLDHWYNNSRILMKQELLMQFKLEYREAIARRETMLKNNLEKINSDLCTGVNDILNCYELTSFEEILSCETVTDPLLLHHFQRLETIESQLFPLSEILQMLVSAIICGYEDIIHPICYEIAQNITNPVIYSSKVFMESEFITCEIMFNLTSEIDNAMLKALMQIVEIDGCVCSEQFAGDANSIKAYYYFGEDPAVKLLPYEILFKEKQKRIEQAKVVFELMTTEELTDTLTDTIYPDIVSQIIWQRKNVEFDVLRTRIRNNERLNKLICKLKGGNSIFSTHLNNIFCLSFFLQFNKTQVVTKQKNTYSMVRTNSFLTQSSGRVYFESKIMQLGSGTACVGIMYGKESDLYLSEPIYLKKDEEIQQGEIKIDPRLLGNQINKDFNTYYLKRFVRFQQASKAGIQDFVRSDQGTIDNPAAKHAMISSDGYIYILGERYQIDQEIKNGDTIGVYLNCVQQMINFSVNDQFVTYNSQPYEDFSFHKTSRELECRNMTKNQNNDTLFEDDYFHELLKVDELIKQCSDSPQYEQAMKRYSELIHKKDNFIFQPGLVLYHVDQPIIMECQFDFNNSIKTKDGKSYTSNGYRLH